MIKPFLLEIKWFYAYKLSVIKMFLTDMTQCRVKKTFLWAAHRLIAEQTKHTHILVGHTLCKYIPTVLL